MRVRITLLVLIALAVAVPFLVLRAQSRAEAEQAEQTTQNLEIFTVQRGIVRDFVETTGTLDADSVALLSFPISGQLAELNVRSGDYVLEGTVLAVLDNDLERLLYEQAALRMNRTEVGFYDLQTVDPDNVAIAEANVQAAWNSYTYARNQLTDEDIAAMQEEYNRQKEEADFLGLEASQAPGGVNSKAWDALMAEYGEMAFGAEIQRLNIELAQIQNDASAWPAYGNVVEAQAELERILAGATDAQLARAALDLRDTNTQLDSAREDYEDTFLLAPFDGVVSDVDTEIGAIVFSNTGILEITDITPLLLSVQIDEIDLNKVTEGASVEVTFDALPDVVVRGTLDEIAPTSTLVNGIVTFEAQIAMEAIPAEARVGMSADVQIITEEISDVLSIPNQFIREDRATGSATVNILTDEGLLVEREIELGLQGVVTSEVVSGLSVGERLAIINEVQSSTINDPFAG